MESAYLISPCSDFQASIEMGVKLTSGNLMGSQSAGVMGVRRWSLALFVSLLSITYVKAGAKASRMYTATGEDIVEP